jgi:hypothetical protein
MALDFTPPLVYSIFFLWIEPISTIVGAYFAHFQPAYYLQLTHPLSAPASENSVPLAVRISLSQLANLYLLFAINESLVLRATRDIRVWKTLLFGLLIADFGHLFTVYPLGVPIYYQFWVWNAIDWGNIAFVYLGAMMRISFLSGVGLRSEICTSFMREPRLNCPPGSSDASSASQVKMQKHL